MSLKITTTACVFLCLNGLARNKVTFMRWKKGQALYLCVSVCAYQLIPRSLNEPFLVWLCVLKNRASWKWSRCFLKLKVSGVVGTWTTGRVFRRWTSQGAFGHLQPFGKGCGLGSTAVATGETGWPVGRLVAVVTGWGAFRQTDKPLREPIGWLS